MGLEVSKGVASSPPRSTLPDFPFVFAPGCASLPSETSLFLAGGVAVGGVSGWREQVRRVESWLRVLEGSVQGLCDTSSAALGEACVALASSHETIAPAELDVHAPRDGPLQALRTNQSAFGELLISFNDAVVKTVVPQLRRAVVAARKASRVDLQLRVDALPNRPEAAFVWTEPLLINSKKQVPLCITCLLSTNPKNKYHSFEGADSLYSWVHKARGLLHIKSKYGNKEYIFHGTNGVGATPNQIKVGQYREHIPRYKRVRG